MNKKTVLILGATGFIGRNFVEHFSKDPSYEVKATWHLKLPFECNNVQWLQVDLRDEKQVREVVEGVDTVIQAAATTSGSKDIINSPFLHVTDNAVMNSYLFRACHEMNVRHLLFFSCSVMYPVNRPSVIEGDVTFDGIHPKYFGVGWTKIYLEKMAEFYSQLGVTKYTVIRHSNVFGPHDKYDLEKSHVFGATMTKLALAKKNNQNEIVVWGEGNELRDLIYIDDLIDFSKLAISKQEVMFFLSNVGSGVGISINELVEKIQKIMGTSIKVVHDLSKPTIPVDIVLNVDKAKKFGWESKIGLEDGIQKTWAWYQENVL